MIAGTLALLWISSARADAPEVWFDYKYSRTVDQGTGAYSGYHERLASSGRYDVPVFATVDEPSVNAKYSWTFSPSDAAATSGRTDRTTTFRKADGRYTTAIDLDDDEWKNVDPTSLSVWFWAAPDAAVGTTVGTLDHTCTVSARDGKTPDGVRAAIVCDATGHGSRHDAYGEMTTSWTETTYYDPASGWIVAQTREETDEGTTSNERATFAMHESLIIPRASYVKPLPPPQFGAAPDSMNVEAPRESTSRSSGFGVVEALTMLFTVGMFLAPFAAIAALVALVLRSQRPPLSIAGTPYGVVTFQRLQAAIEVSRFAKTSATAAFAPFLEDFARKALANGDPVHLAVAGDDLVGFGLLDGETKLGTVFAPDAAVAAGLVRWLGCQDFFTETRHQRATGARIYNVFETFKVLRLDAIPELAYDAALVQPLQPGDRDELIALAAALNPGVPVEKWLSAQLVAGDLCYVARLDGKIAGYGFATVADTRARLHTLGVDPARRDAGIGKELVRGRLAALRAIGVTEVISEISEGAPASLHIALELGFHEIGQMFVETTRSERVTRPIVRR